MASQFPTDEEFPGAPKKRSPASEGMSLLGGVSGFDEQAVDPNAVSGDWGAGGTPGGANQPYMPSDGGSGLGGNPQDTLPYMPNDGSSGLGGSGLPFSPNDPDPLAGTGGIKPTPDSLPYMQGAMPPDGADPIKQFDPSQGQMPLGEGDVFRGGMLSAMGMPSDNGGPSFGGGSNLPGGASSPTFLPGEPDPNGGHPGSYDGSYTPPTKLGDNTESTKVYDTSGGQTPLPENTAFKGGDAAPQAGQWAPNNQGFLDWATKTFGVSPTRGGGFVDIPPGQLQAILQRYTEETGNQANYQGGPSGDRVDFGQGVQDALTSGGQVWNAAGGGGAPSGGGGSSAPPKLNNDGPSFGGTKLPPGVSGLQGAQAPPPTATYTPTPISAPSQTNLQNPATGQQSEVDRVRRAKLLEMLGKSSEPFDPSTNPGVQAQTTAYSTARNRAADQSRAKLAERAAASGLNSGGQGSGSFDAGLGGIYDDAGRDNASFGAGVIGQEYQAQRQEKMQLLQLANAVGAQDEAQQLQLDLATLDDQYRKQALAQNHGQFQDQMGFNYAGLNQNQNQFGQQMGFNYAGLNQNNNQFNANLNQQGNQFNANLNQNQSQWNDQYGLNMQQLLYGMDRDSILQALLGGG